MARKRASATPQRRAAAPTAASNATATNRLGVAGQAAPGTAAQQPGPADYRAAVRSHFGAVVRGR